MMMASSWGMRNVTNSLHTLGRSGGQTGTHREIKATWMTERPLACFYQRIVEYGANPQRKEAGDEKERVVELSAA